MAVTVTLIKPLVIKPSPAALEQEPLTIAEISLALDALTLADVEKAAQSSALPTKIHLDPGFQAALAEKASGHPLELLHKLEARDFATLILKVQAFLLEIVEWPAAVKLKLEELTGADVDAAGRIASAERVAATGNAIGVMVFDASFHLHIAAASSGLSLETLRALPAREGYKVLVAISDFFVDTDSAMVPKPIAA